MATVLHPKNNKITVLRDPPKEKSEGGIQLTSEITDHRIGTVLEVGPGKIYPGPEGPVRFPPDYSPGDRVLYSAFCGMDMQVGGKEICVLTDEDIIGVLEGEGE